MPEEKKSPDAKVIILVLVIILAAVLMLARTRGARDEFAPGRPADTEEERRMAVVEDTLAGDEISAEERERLNRELEELMEITEDWDLIGDDSNGG